MERSQQTIKNLERDSEQKAAFARMAENALKEVATNHPAIDLIAQDKILRRIREAIVHVANSQERVTLVRAANAALRNELTESELINKTDSERVCDLFSAILLERVTRRV